METQIASLERQELNQASAWCDRRLPWRHLADIVRLRGSSALHLNMRMTVLPHSARRKDFATG